MHFFSAKSLFFHGCKIFVAGFVNVVSIYENTNGKFASDNAIIKVE